jgi:hypothetical protein
LLFPDLCPYFLGEDHRVIMINASRSFSIGWNRLPGIGCIIGLAIGAFGCGGVDEAKKDSAAETATALEQKEKRPVRTMNLALGNVVYFARDLGFAVKNDAGAFVDGAKIATRIENQLHGMRELYRQEIAKNEDLTGSLIVQFRVAPNGDVSEVREHAGRMLDGQFKKAVANQAATWSFPDLVAENLEVTCPLLFVQEGMDITTLVRWEKSLEDGSVKTASINPAAVRPQSKSAAAPAPATTAAPMTPPRAPLRSEAKEYRIKYAATLRKDPNFAAPTLLTFTIGTRVTVLGRQGDWLEVRSRAEGPTGFIRKEFVTPIEVARQ